VHFSFIQQLDVAGLLFVVVQGCCGSLWCGYCPEWNTSGSTINYATLTTTNQFGNASAFDHKTGVFQVIRRYPFFANSRKSSSLRMPYYRGVE
jgi:hypothetical protein